MRSGAVRFPSAIWRACWPMMMVMLPRQQVLIHSAYLIPFVITQPKKYFSLQNQDAADLCNFLCIYSLVIGISFSLFMKSEIPLPPQKNDLVLVARFCN